MLFPCPFKPLSNVNSILQLESVLNSTRTQSKPNPTPLCSHIVTPTPLNLRENRPHPPDRQCSISRGARGWGRHRLRRKISGALPHHLVVLRGMWGVPEEEDQSFTVRDGDGMAWVPSSGTSMAGSACLSFALPARLHQPDDGRIGQACPWRVVCVTEQCLMHLLPPAVCRFPWCAGVGGWGRPGWLAGGGLFKSRVAPPLGFVERGLGGVD